MKKDQKQFVSAIIVAAGKGTRMNMDINKQYVEVRDIPILARTLSVFARHRLVDEIVLVVNEADILYCKQEIVEGYEIKKVKCITAGGKERQQSVFNGLQEVSKNAGIVLIHDGARPFVTEDCIGASIKVAAEYGAACVAVPVKDTIKAADSEQFIESTLERTKLWSIQTPQTFKYDTILKAHEIARENGFVGTDDAVLAENIGVRVKLVMGDYFNIKITTQEDLTLAEAIIDRQKG
ncbi:MAG: 2-C-methyl-D-erythritol 4-phosphate cytidylyltransferase [Clostridia bacterium]|nr:2-C-methyl-D-erythritol 4-phosphate cytidylyltransferase [Clostridia bacterium]